MEIREIDTDSHYSEEVMSILERIRKYGNELDMYTTNKMLKFAEKELGKKGSFIELSAFYDRLIYRIMDCCYWGKFVDFETILADYIFSEFTLYEVTDGENKLYVLVT
mgnify:CR=1 FL=1